MPSTDATTLAALRDDSIEPSGPTVKDTAEHQDGALAKDTVAELTTEEKQEDRTLRGKGDKSLYAFYFRSTKTWVSCCWLCLIIIMSIASALPGK